MPEPENNLPVPSSPLAMLLAAAFFVAPLIFFTNLTRNPYYFQITLLNTAVLGAAALFIWGSLKRGRWLLPASALNKPLAALTLVYLASFAWAWFGHAPFFRPAIAAEGARLGMFFVVNCLAVFYLALALPSPGDDSDVPAGRWLAFILGWGALWFLFPFLKMQLPGDGFFEKVFDPYGALVWVSGFTAAYLLARRCRQADVLHLALAAGAIAALYGVLEYFHVELVWGKLLNPYGNRSVSTFGNPNFISSYLVLFMPLAASLLMKADTAAKRWLYGVILLSYAGMLMCSLTRSSWIGAAAAFAFMFAFGSHRAQLKARRKFLYPFFAAALLMVLFWPSDSLKLFSSGLFDRVSEAVVKVSSPAEATLAGEAGEKYGSFHQRLLIWTSAWQMGAENPLLGKGYGLFELFYPFYQGRAILNFPAVRNLRTHANNAHNEIMEQWAQAGLLGLGAWLWFLAALFWGFWRFYRSAGDEARYAAVPLAAGLVGMLADNMLNVSIHFAVPALGFWWVAGALARRTCGVGAYPAWRRPRAAAAAAWLLLACCAGGAFIWQRQFLREFRYFNGFKLMRGNNTAAAAAELYRAWQAHPREVNSNYEMGNAYARAGDEPKAVWAYREALKSNAGYDEIYFNLAIVLKRQGRAQEALDLLKVSSLINPLNSVTWQAMAEIYLAAPDRAAVAAEAAAHFKEAVRAFPRDPVMWNTLGYFHTLLRDYPAARAAYARGVKMDPSNRMLVENLAGVARQMGLKKDPDLDWYNAYAALAPQADSGPDVPGMLRRADALVALDPANARALMVRGKLLFRAGRLAEARADLEAALREAPFENQARYGLAVILEKEGNIPAAVSQWQRFLETEPGNAAVAARLAALQQRR